MTAGSAVVGAAAITAAPAQAAVLHGDSTPPPAPAAAATARIISPPVITVQKGEYLSEIAAKDCGTSADWTGIFAANKKIINPDLVYEGELLVLSCKTAPLPKPVVTAAAVIPQQHHYSTPVVTGTYHGSGSMQQCIISRESGGNAGIWNASGHWGLYQFSESTWIAHGGSAASFGKASIAEQNQIYYNTVAQDGYSDWAPYDGC